MLYHMLWTPARVMNWYLYPIEAISCWKRAYIGVVKVFLPVKRGRAVVRQQLIRVFFMDGVGKFFSKTQVRLYRFHTTRGRRKARRPSRGKWLVLHRFSPDKNLRSCAHRCKMACRNRRHRRSIDLPLRRRYAPAVRWVHPSHQPQSALQSIFAPLPGWAPIPCRPCGRISFAAGQLVFKVHSGCTGRDHVFHQLVCIEYTTKARFCVGDNGQK